MSKIELTIDANYFSSWSTEEGIRDFLQNGKDAEIQFNAPLVVTWYNDTIRIENTGTKLPLEALLLGFTTKTNHDELAGKYGEGIKAATVALLRAGHNVKIRSGSEVWNPSIQDSNTFKAKVLVFDIQGGRKDENRVRVEVDGISKTRWEEMRSNFLFLEKPAEGESVHTYSGDLLLGEKYKGKLFVKGIYVQSDPNMNYGYNFGSATLDRDRKMVDSFDVKYYTKDIWNQAATKRPDLLGLLYSCLENETADVAGISDLSFSSMSQTVIDHAAQVFASRFGNDAIPVASMEESKDIEHFGKRGIIVPKPLKAILTKKLGDFNTIKEKMAKETIKIYGWSDLSDSQKKNLENALELLKLAIPTAGLDNIDIADFHNQGLLGQFKGGRVLVASKCLGTVKECLRVLVHEYAHFAGGDGEVNHVHAIEEIWMAIVGTLWA